MKENFDYVIGSSEDADIRLSHKDIADKHAVFRRRGDRLFIKPLAKDSGTYLNGSTARPGRFQEFTRFDKLRLGGLPLELSSGLFMGRERLGIGCTPIFFRGRGGRLLSNGITFQAHPGSVTAIMGPSGCGKSVFLKLLAGINPPDKGKVFLTSAVGEHIPINSFEHQPIAFVPQGDTMFPELSTGCSLDYRLRLLFSDMRRDVRERLIRQTVQRVGFIGKRGEQFLDTQIGSADASGAYLSGGERRRANLCHELISQPLILILDEPTSGLSSRDADEVMNLLKRLANEEGLTIITTIHQPSETAFSQIDQLILLSYGGTIAYRGPAGEAVARISNATGNRKEKKSASEYVVESHELLAGKPLLEESNIPEEEQLDSKTQQKQKGPRRLEGLAKQSLDWFNQLPQLCQRQQLLMIKDHSSIAFALLQIPILFALVFVTFNGSSRDYEDFDQLIRTQHEYQEIREIEGGIPENGLNRAFLQAERNEDLVSSAHARHRASFIYILTLIAIWFGLMSGCCDIVVRREIIAREFRSGISLFHTILALFATNSFLALFQAFAVAGLSLVALPQISMVNPPSLFTAIFFVTITSVALGLLISSSGKSARSGLTLVPVCLIPQILLGGLFRPLHTNGGLYTLLANLNPQRWAFNIALTHSDFANSGVIRPEIGTLQSGPSFGMYSTLVELVQFSESGIKEIYFPVNREIVSVTPISALVSMCLVFLFCTYWFTRKGFRN